MKKTKWGDYEQRYPIPTFNFEIVAVFSHNLSESVRARFTDVGPRLQHHAVKAFHKVPSEDGTSYLFFGYDATPEHIAHESWHAIRYMLEDWAGAKLENETVAYHLGYLVGLIHKFKSKLEVLHGTEDAQRKTSGLSDLQSTPD